jgi:protein-S-isoprenylcysteine O-methyltransferase Ste14
LRWPPYAVFATVGGILLALGMPMLLTAGITLRPAYNRDELVTSGVFAVVRHPIYSAMIVLNLPGIALLTRSWPLFLMPLVAYTVFKLLIHREDEYLERRFGQAYLDYRARVNEVIPLPRFWLRK